MPYLHPYLHTTLLCLWIPLCFPELSPHAGFLLSLRRRVMSCRLPRPEDHALAFPSVWMDSRPPLAHVPARWPLLHASRCQMVHAHASHLIPAHHSHPLYPAYFLQSGSQPDMHISVDLLIVPLPNFNGSRPVLFYSLKQSLGQSRCSIYTCWRHKQLPKNKMILPYRLNEILTQLIIKIECKRVLQTILFCPWHSVFVWKCFLHTFYWLQFSET